MKWPRRPVAWLSCRVGLVANLGHGVRARPKVRTLKALGPSAGDNAQDLQHIVVHAVEDNEGSFGDDEFARPWRAAGMTELRVFQKKLFDTMKDVQGHTLGRCRIVG
jgi:hypothetical protein